MQLIKAQRLSQLCHDKEKEKKKQENALRKALTSLILDASSCLSFETWAIFSSNSCLWKKSKLSKHLNAPQGTAALQRGASSQVYSLQRGPGFASLRLQN